MFQKLISLAPFAALVVIACGNTHTGVRSNKVTLADTYQTTAVMHEGAADKERRPLVFVEQAPSPLRR